MYKRLSSHLPSLDLPDFPDLPDAFRETANRMETALHQAKTSYDSHQQAQGAARNNQQGEKTIHDLQQNGQGTAKNLQQGKGDPSHNVSLSTSAVNQSINNKSIPAQRSASLNQENAKEPHDCGRGTSENVKYSDTTSPNHSTQTEEDDPDVTNVKGGKEETSE